MLNILLQFRRQTLVTSKESWRCKRCTTSRRFRAARGESVAIGDCLPRRSTGLPGPDTTALRACDFPFWLRSALPINQSPGEKSIVPVRIRRFEMAPLIAGTMIDQGRYYAPIGAVRRPRAALIPRLPPARLLSGLTSFWPDCLRDFSSAFARRFEFLFAIRPQYSRPLPFRQWLRRVGKYESVTWAAQTKLSYSPPFICATN
jgi:hypothetical protein